VKDWGGHWVIVLHSVERRRKSIIGSMVTRKGYSTLVSGWYITMESASASANHARFLIPVTFR
jgi:hypothetical protein